MSDALTVTFACKPGRATPALALDVQQRVLNYIQAIADDVEPGAVTFSLTRMEWIDDGRDEIVVTISTPEATP